MMNIGLSTIQDITIFQKIIVSYMCRDYGGDTDTNFNLSLICLYTYIFGVKMPMVTFLNRCAQTYFIIAVVLALNTHSYKGLG